MRRAFAFLLCLLGLFAVNLSFAAETRKSYDIPAGEALASFKKFTIQSGEQLLYSTDAVEGVTTNAVKGTFTAREALSQMIDGTNLAVVADKKNGALSLVRTVDPNALRAALKNSVRPEKNGTPSGDETLVMSPFVVGSTQDTGYQATSTLAGTRLNTPLKDLGASISVYTRDFIDDLGITNANELMVYATNMEAGGPGGNISGASNDLSEPMVVGDAVRVSPQSSVRTRGLASPSFTRGFFLTGIALDGYNIERVTVNRGPNAALFGVGSPAGVVDHTLLLPDLHRNKNQVVMRYGNNDSLRGSVDFNRVLIPKKLAARIAAVRDREEYNQRPAFEEKKRIYGALTFEPFKSTALRVNFESGNTRANRPFTVLPMNSISKPWYDEGKPTFDWTYYDDPARNPNAAAQDAGLGNYHIFFGQGTIFDQLAEIYDTPNATAASRAFRTVQNVLAGNPLNQVRGGTLNPLINRDSAGDSIRFVGTRNIYSISLLYWQDHVLPGQQPGLWAPAGIKNQTFTDFSAFDWKNRMIDETSRQGESFHTFNAALEQRFWKDRIGIEAAYAKERVDRRARNSFFQRSNNNEIRVDVNVTLPTGEPNPNLGRPFTISNWSTWFNSLTERETSRVTGYLKYNFNDLSPSWGKWFGRHTVTGLYENYAIEDINYQTRLAADGPAARAMHPDISQAPRKIGRVVYLGPSIIGNNNPLQLQPIQIPSAAVGPSSIPVRFFFREANATDPGHFEDVPLSWVEINNGGGTQREVIESKAAVLQSYWLRDQLVTMVGWRRDADYSDQKSFNHVRNPSDLNDPGKVHYSLDDFSFPRTPTPRVAKEIVSYSAVLNWPRKLINLPAGTNISLFYNRSENFTPLGTRRNAFREDLPSPQGQTTEYGFNLWGFGDRLSLRVNRFETSIAGATFNPAVVGMATNTAMFQQTQSWMTEGNINPHLMEMRDAQFELLFSTLPANYRDLYKFQRTGETPNLATSYNSLSPSDTTDYVSTGTEIELALNPTRNWRIMVNVARQETVQSNMVPTLKKFMGLMKPVWEQLRDVPQNNYPDGWQPGDSLVGIPTYGGYLDKFVMVPYATLLATEGQASAEQRKWRANLVTNYAFDRGSIFGVKLKGWSVGAGVRWQDKLGIGYPTTRNPDGSVNVDIKHPWYAPAETNADAWVGYKRKLWNNRINWEVKLNVRNLYRERELIPIGVQPWGEIASYRLAPERRWYLTNTFGF